jgi:hypothetical protein
MVSSAVVAQPASASAAAEAKSKAFKCESPDKKGARGRGASLTQPL